MKVNFWQILGVILIVVGCVVVIVRETGKTDEVKKDTPTEKASGTPAPTTAATSVPTTQPVR